MKLDFWNRRDCECAAIEPAPVPTKEEERVCRMSPARLLANSLTDPETRGEWVRASRPNASVYGHSVEYINGARDLIVSRWWASGIGCFGDGVTTPFTLSKAEERIVKDALNVFDRHLKDVAEAKALSRLTAPALGIEAATAGETGTGSTRSAKARPAKRGTPKGDQQ